MSAVGSFFCVAHCSFLFTTPPESPEIPGRSSLAVVTVVSMVLIVGNLNACVNKSPANTNSGAKKLYRNVKRTFKPFNRINRPVSFNCSLTENVPLRWS